MSWFLAMKHPPAHHHGDFSAIAPLSWQLGGSSVFDHVWSVLPGVHKALIDAHVTKFGELR
jgi:hypothetical protein